MTVFILAVVLQANANSLISSVNPPPPSSSPVREVAPNYDDVKFTRSGQVPADILSRIPRQHADYIAKRAKLGNPVFIADQFFYT